MVAKKMTSEDKRHSLDRDRSISGMTMEEMREEIREEVVWCWRLWSFLCAVFTMEFWVTNTRKRE